MKTFWRDIRPGDVLLHRRNWAELVVSVTVTEGCTVQIVAHAMWVPPNNPFFTRRFTTFERGLAERIFCDVWEAGIN